MRHFTILRGYIVDCAPDGRVGINARIFAAVDSSDPNCIGAQVLVDHANLAADAVAILCKLAAWDQSHDDVRLISEACSEARAIIERARGLS